MINGTHGSEIISNTNLVINHLNFIDKVISQPEDLFIPLLSSKIQTNHIDIGENNINLIYNFTFRMFNQIIYIAKDFIYWNFTSF